ncbi:hypothetical protein [Paraburkholderia adhaesiva]|uniref:hypothetical protein n=1 Tax=Paraburkholderia adhaesiva TaxID=2883244 RepID=UPI001F1DB38F|nr:hypothetical protein [Paraburkholderia adhaesiva]
MVKSETGGKALFYRYLRANPAPPCDAGPAHSYAVAAADLPPGWRCLTVLAGRVAGTRRIKQNA